MPRASRTLIVLAGLLVFAAACGVTFRASRTSRLREERAGASPASAEAQGSDTERAAEETASSEGASEPPADGPRPSAFETRIMGYNVLFEYQQVALRDGSFPSWVCSMYPFVVDHPELRWENRFSALQRTIESVDPDILGLTEMRGGVPVSDTGGPDPACDPRDGVMVIRDLTDWMRDGGRYRYRWLSVLDVDPSRIEYDPLKSQRWPGPRCRYDMGRDDCRVYDPRADRYSTKSFIAYRPGRYRVVDSGAFELPTSNVAERRFAPWARLEERASGISIVVVVVHLDPYSGAHRVASARRLVRFVEETAPHPVAILGDFNMHMQTGAECDCSCASPDTCSCPSEVIQACAGQNAWTVLTSAGLLDTFHHLTGRDDSTVMSFHALAGQPRYSGEQPCWPRGMTAPGRAHAPVVEVHDPGSRIDYIFTARARPLDASVVTPVTGTMTVDGEERTILPSDHRAVMARVRAGTDALTATVGHENPSSLRSGAASPSPGPASAGRDRPRTLR
ncbi:MAG: endonuclease/exonuclease/phosphatase family protein [Sandaracinaceae bacterium]